MEPLVFVELFLQVVQVGLHVQQLVAVPNRCNVGLSTAQTSLLVLSSIQIISRIIKMQNKQSHTCLLGSPAQI